MILGSARVKAAQKMLMKLKLGGELAVKSARLTCEVKRLERMLAEKAEKESCNQACDEMVQKLSQELKNTKNTLKIKNIEIRMLKDKY